MHIIRQDHFCWGAGGAATPSALFHGGSGVEEGVQGLQPPSSD